MTTKTFTAEAEVDVDLSEWDTDDLVEELRTRGIEAPDTVDTDDLTEMFYAFKLGREDRAVQIARKIAQDFTGAIL